MKIKLGVIFGGETVEHEVSIISAIQAIENIDEDKYEVIPIYITKDRVWYTGKFLRDMNVYKDMELLKRYAKEVVLYKKDGEFVLQSTKGMFKSVVTTLDVVLPIVHGQNVEDGSLAGYLDTIGIPYAGPSILGAAIGQDKVVMKEVFKANNLPIVPYTWFYDVEYNTKKEDILKEIKKVGYPVIVKPARLGSSVGIRVVKKDTDIDEAINEAIDYDSKIIVEKVIDNLVEVNCSVLGNYEYAEASVLEEVTSSKDYLTYQEKYMGGSKGKFGIKNSTKGMASASRKIPATIGDKLTKEVQELAKQTFKALNLSGVCRIDFLIDGKAKKAYINEPNTIPGSLSFYLWNESNKTYTELLDEIVTLAIRNYKNKEKKTHSFNTNILSGYNGVKGMKGKLK
ncbi:MAG: D-alanine--D-alanine ligase [Bacilli bacterium]|nr:D-alanine--D-alanine ligase [Bacilli bacterium]